MVSEDDLKRIYGQPDKPYFVNVGHIAGAESIPALIDVNKLVTRHSAVVGTTKTYAGQGFGFEQDSAKPLLEPVLTKIIVALLSYLFAKA